MPQLARLRNAIQTFRYIITIDIVYSHVARGSREHFDRSKTLSHWLNGMVRSPVSYLRTAQALSNLS